jgi:hypothetical protein
LRQEINRTFPNVINWSEPTRRVFERAQESRRRIIDTNRTKHRNLPKSGLLRAHARSSLLAAALHKGYAGIKKIIINDAPEVNDTLSTSLVAACNARSFGCLCV